MRIYRALMLQQVLLFDDFTAICKALGLDVVKTIEQAQATLADADYVSDTYDPANQWELAAAGEYEQDPDDETAMMMQEP